MSNHRHALAGASPERIKPLWQLFLILACFSLIAAFFHVHEEDSEDDHEEERECVVCLVAAAKDALEPPEPVILVAPDQQYVRPTKPLTSFILRTRFQSQHAPRGPPLLPSF